MKEGILDNLLFYVKKLIPKSVFIFFQPAYHTVLAYGGAFLYGYPSKKLKVIGVTGTKGKSTVVYMIAKLFEDSSKPVGACGSLGFKINDKEWPNTLKMTMPGRFRLQKLMAEAVKAECEYFVLEVTSEGIKQKRHLGINFDCAVFTNLHKEHLESHGSFEKYYGAKQELFRLTANHHVINADDPNYELFSKFHSKKTIFYGLKSGDIIARDIKTYDEGSSFEIYGTVFNTHLAGEFNILNCLAALSVGIMYGLDLPSIKPVLESIKYIPGRMEFLPSFGKTSSFGKPSEDRSGSRQKKLFDVVVDYAHTPDSLEAVYKTLKPKSKRLICVLGAAGGGRDKWKRSEFGRIAAQYCDEIILTNEDPYDENPEEILEEISSGFSQASNGKNQNPNFEKILDRKEAIKKAISMADKGDKVIITGKGSETSMALAEGKKIPWSDKKIVIDLLEAKS